MPRYEYYCEVCDAEESFEQPFSAELIPPECPEHGTMRQDYQLGIRKVFGVGSSPNRTVKSTRKKL